MHVLDWLNERGHILHEAIQPIECVLFASFSLSLQCDSALSCACGVRRFVYLIICLLFLFMKVAVAIQEGEDSTKPEHP